MACTIVTGDGRRVRVSRSLVVTSSILARRVLESQDSENAEMNVPEVDGDTVETLVRVMAGEVAVDLMAPGNGKLLAGAQVLGMVPRQTLSLASLFPQVRKVEMF